MTTWKGSCGFTKEGRWDQLPNALFLCVMHADRRYTGLDSIRARNAVAAGDSSRPERCAA
jgi:hypothetical protein